MYYYRLSYDTGEYEPSPEEVILGHTEKYTNENIDRMLTEGLEDFVNHGRNDEEEIDLYTKCIVRQGRNLINPPPISKSVAKYLQKDENFWKSKFEYAVEYYHGVLTKPTDIYLGWEAFEHAVNYMQKVFNFVPLVCEASVAKTHGKIGTRPPLV
jgi:hypothetical protein